MISAGRRQKKKAVAQQPFDTPIRPAAALNDQGRRFSFARHRIGGLRPDVAGVHADDIPVNFQMGNLYRIFRNSMYSIPCN